MSSSTESSQISHQTLPDSAHTPPERHHDAESFLQNVRGRRFHYNLRFGALLTTALAGGCAQEDYPNVPIQIPDADEPPSPTPEGTPEPGTQDGDGDGVPPVEGDCDDANAAVNPNAPEVCDGADNDCDGLTDDADSEVSNPPTWYQDSDFDGYGNEHSTVIRCSAPTGYTDNSEDCDDSDAAVHPGAAETCNEIDDNCDGDIDEGLTKTWYYDFDEDGYGDPEAQLEDTCDPPQNYIATAGDCDDMDASVNPSAEERCDNIDNDCDTAKDDADSTVHCFPAAIRQDWEDGDFTATTLCQEYLNDENARADLAVEYWWGSCAGPGDCPEGFNWNTFSCESYVQDPCGRAFPVPEEGETVAYTSEGWPWSPAGFPLDPNKVRNMTEDPEGTSWSLNQYNPGGTFGVFCRLTE